MPRVALSHARMRSSILSALLLCACASAPIANAPQSPDEAAIRHIVNDVYAIVSGDKGQARDWDRLRSHFLKDGAMHVSMQRGDRTAAASFDVEQFIAMASQNSQQEAFYESPLVTRIEAFAGVGYSWSSYQSQKSKDAEPFARGVNCFTFVKTKDGWRIASIAWSEENESAKLPTDMLTPAR
jgi:hypothetical protein